MGWCAVQPGKASSERASEGVRKRKRQRVQQCSDFPSRYGAKKSTDAHEYRAVRAREPMEREVR